MCSINLFNVLLYINAGLGKFQCHFGQQGYFFAIPLTRYPATKHMASYVSSYVLFARYMEISMYLALCFIARYMEISMYLVICLIARYLEISMYLAICFIARYMEISMYLAICFIARYMPCHMFNCKVHGNFHVP